MFRSTARPVATGARLGYPRGHRITGQDHDQDAESWARAGTFWLPVCYQTGRRGPRPTWGAVMAAKGMGRPRFPEGEALSERVTTRFRPKELADVQAAADEAGVSIAEWLRRVALAAARRAQLTARRRTRKKG